MSDTTKVLVELDGANVSVNVLTDRGGVVALNPYSRFAHLGTVREVAIPGQRPNTTKHVWQWSSEGYSGTAGTKKRAVADMLADCGYEQVTLEAKIPDLLAGLE